MEATKKTGFDITEEVESCARTNIDWAKLDNRTILISGSTGLVGKYLILSLLARNRLFGLHTHIIALGRNRDKFYQRFAVDSAFQVQSMNSSVIFTGPDPDNDFGTITGEISPDQWPSFKPAFLPHGLIYNIIYGQKYTEGNQKIFVIQGIANGLETQMTFRRKGNRWKLVSFSY